MYSFTLREKAKLRCGRNFEIIREWHSVERIPPPRPLIPKNCYYETKMPAEKSPVMRVCLRPDITVTLTLS